MYFYDSCKLKTFILLEIYFHSAVVRTFKAAMADRQEYSDLIAIL